LQVVISLAKNFKSASIKFCGSPELQELVIMMVALRPRHPRFARMIIYRLLAEHLKKYPLRTEQ
jgi:hypothetical protein